MIFQDDFPLMGEKKTKLGKGEAVVQKLFKVGNGFRLKCYSN